MIPKPQILTGVRVLGIGVQGVGFRASDCVNDVGHFRQAELASKYRIWGFGFRVSGFGFRVQGFDSVEAQRRQTVSKMSVISFGRVFMINTRPQRKFLHSWIILVILKQRLVQIVQIDGPLEYL